MLSTRCVLHYLSFRPCTCVQGWLQQRHIMDPHSAVRESICAVVSAPLSWNAWQHLFRRCSCGHAVAKTPLTCAAWRSDMAKAFGPSWACKDSLHFTAVTDELVQLVRADLSKRMPQEPLVDQMRKVLGQCSKPPTWNTWQFMVRKLAVGLRLPYVTNRSQYCSTLSKCFGIDWEGRPPLRRGVAARRVLQHLGHPLPLKQVPRRADRPRLRKCVGELQRRILSLQPGQVVSSSLLTSLQRLVRRARTYLRARPHSLGLVSQSSLAALQPGFSPFSIRSTNMLNAFVLKTCCILWPLAFSMFSSLLSQRHRVSPPGPFTAT